MSQESDKRLTVPATEDSSLYGTTRPVSPTIEQRLEGLRRGSVQSDVEETLKQLKGWDMGGGKKKSQQQGQSGQVGHSKAEDGSTPGTSAEDIRTDSSQTTPTGGRKPSTPVPTRVQHSDPRLQQIYLAMDVHYKSTVKDIEDAKGLLQGAAVEMDELRGYMEAINDGVAEYDVHYRTYCEKCSETVSLLSEFQNPVRLNSKLMRERGKVASAIGRLEVNRQGAHSGGPATPTLPQDTYRIHLPKRELPKFDGNVRNWLSFWASYKEINDDKNIPDGEKFQYLLQCMVKGSEAHKVVASYPASDSNYKLAVQTLEQRFGNKKTLVKVYVRDLLKLVVENAKEKPTLSFNDLVTSLTSQLRNLEELGVNSAQHGMILYPVVESCVPVSTLEGYMRKSACLETIEDLVNYLNDEVQRKLQSSLARAPFKEEKVPTPKPEAKQGKSTPATANFHNATGNRKCVFCSGDHSSERCNAAKKMTAEAKREAVRISDLCFRCLQSGHNSKGCRTSVTCENCGKRSHVTVMCGGGGERKNEVKRSKTAQPKKDNENGGSSRAIQEESSSSGAEVKANMANYVRKPEVLLQTLCVDVHGVKGKRKVRAMFDSGSQSSYVLTHVANEVGLPLLGEEKTTHMTFGGDYSSEKVHPVFKMEVSAEGGDKRILFDVSGVDKISGRLDSIPEGSWLTECRSRGITLNDVGNNSSEIEMLIGADVSGRMMVGQRNVELPSGPVAQQTLLGWVLQGKLPIKRKVNSSGAMLSISMHNQTKTVAELWELEAIGITDAAESKSRREIEEAAMEHFKSTVSRNDSGRYIVHLPWLEAHHPLPDNKSMAVKRLESMTKGLLKDGHLLAYNKVFEDWLAEGIIEKVPEHSKGKGNLVHYLPHRAVFKEGSTTPLRPVFDASAKSKGNPSLNGCLEKGPNLLEMIPSLLTRFRLGKVGAVADIKKAFLQMEVVPQHRDSLRFLWWENPEDRKKLAEFRHRRVVFGVSSSPFLLGVTLNHHLSQSCEFPEAAARLMKSFYVDNAVVSFSSMEEARQFQEQSVEILKTAQFDLRGWEFGPGKEEVIVQVLGLVWNTYEDTLQVESSKFQEHPDKPITKRSILSTANSVYDPLGFLSPFTLMLKLLLKEIWIDEEKFKWDDKLPVKYCENFAKLSKQMAEFCKIIIPRYVGGEASSRSSWSLHVFCDASKEAYATCVFLRVDEQPISVQLIQAKTRVSPQKNVTIPRLELLSCLIGSRLAHSVKKDMEMPEIPVTYWTDSSTALTWIRRSSTWATFVMNRVKEIRELTDISAWRHVAGEINPADLVSRGCSVKRLINSEWWEGPGWLYLPQLEWPTSSVQVNEDEVDGEKRKTVVSALATNRENCVLKRLERQSDYHRLLRVMALVLRFKENLCKRIREDSTRQNEEQSEGPLVISAEELEKAEKEVIKMIQSASFPNQMNLRPLKCNLFEDGIIRVSTKLIEGDTPFYHPAVLPGDHHIVRRLIAKEHELACHAGTQYLQSILREKYWILKSRKSIRSVVRECTTCRRYAAERCGAEEPPLPLPRTKLSRAYQVTGVDMAGPLFVDGGRKVWIALFTCAVYRAVHLELVAELSTNAFMNAFTKFVSRRGRPEIVYSDNGKNFVGAAKVFQGIGWDEIQRKTSLQRIHWKFIVPSAAWWGGWWERLIGLLKQLLKRVIGTRKLKRDQLEVILCEAESTMNDRPMTYVADDPSDLKPITPAMFVRDLAVAALPETGLLKRLQKMTKMREEMRNRFRREYLGQLVQCSRSKKMITVKPGDVVLVEIDNSKRQDWPVGLVTEVYPGIDNVIRTAKVRTRMGELLRPLQRLFLLEVGQ